MEFDQPIRFGSLCPRCDKGMMKIKGRFPSSEKLGLTTVVYEWTNGNEVTVEDGRGASALLAAARSGRVINTMMRRKQARLA